MPTPAYTELDSNKPDGTTGTGTTYSSSDLANVRALRDLAITGRALGFVESRTTGTGADASHPQFITWLSSALGIGFRMNMTWANTHQVGTCQWQWSNDSGATWTNMGSAQANTFDASDNITASTNSGGMATWIMEIWAKCLRAVAGINAHGAATGTSVHGLGTMSTQNANAVAVTGGNANAMTVGASTRALGHFTHVAESIEILAPATNAGATVDWSVGGSSLTVAGTNVLTFANVASGLAGHILYTTAFNNTTFPASVSFGTGGKPSIAGAVMVSMVTFDSGVNVFATVFFQ
ncbi:MAG TPA: hypothetical protein VLH12_08645 [Usitatibacter sp.]|nr:hypothetical protein [Usitatibacter sp.]